MGFLILAVLGFGIVHVAPSIPVVKSALRDALGKAYGPVYGVISAILLGLCIYAFRQAEAESLYLVPVWGRYANFILSLLGFICIGIFLFRGSWRNRLKYPMAIGVVLWAVGHLLANGDKASLVLFAGMAAFAVLHAGIKASLGAYEPTEVRHGHNLLSVLGGIALYGIMTQLHYVITGMRLVHLS